MNKKNLFILLVMTLLILPCQISASSIKENINDEVPLRIGQYDVVKDYNFYQGKTVPWGVFYKKDGFNYYKDNLHFVGMNEIKFTYYRSMNSDLKVYKICNGSGFME